MIPQTFAEWKHCIEYECKIQLTQTFVKKRLAVYQDPQNAETKKFISLYGKQHLNNIIQWLKQV
jgi:hypothetical protein